jgi:glucose/arabinose dehydrogenase
MSERWWCLLASVPLACASDVEPPKARSLPVPPPIAVEQPRRDASERPVIPAPDAAAAWVPDGYRAEVAIAGLMYPTSVEFDNDGAIYVAEGGYMPGDASQPARLLKFAAPVASARMAGGEAEVVLSEGLAAPVTDLLWHDGKLFVSHKGRISVLENGRLQDLVTDLPSLGDHSNNQLAAGPDGWIYFGQGSATNSGVVGPDNFAFGWPQEHPEVCDVPAHDIVLAGAVFESEDPRAPGTRASTSPFHPFGTTATAGTVVKGAIKSNGSLLRMQADGSDLEVYAWGFRNPYGVQWVGDALYVADAGMDERGSRHVANEPEKLFRVTPGGFYGWPDFAAGKPVSDAEFRPGKAAAPQAVLQEHPPVEPPFMTFDPHASITQMDVSGGGDFGAAGTLYIGASGDQSAVTAAEIVRAGYWVKRVDPDTALAEPFFHTAVDRLGPTGLEYIATPGPKRIVDVRFSHDGRALYVVDIGPIHYEQGDQGPQPVAFPGTGVVWRITKDGP